MKRRGKRGAIWAAVVALALGGGALRAEEGGAENAPVVSDNRWAIVFDASRPAESSEAQARVDAARAKFRADLEASGIAPDHIFVYSTTAKDPARRPTRETILNALDALRDVDGVCKLYDAAPGERKPFWRETGNDYGDALCEIQIYVTAPAFSADDGKRDWLVPCDASLDDLAELDDAARAERLVSVGEIEDALTCPLDEDATPIQRTFLAVNFLTIETTTRGDDATRFGPANEVDLARSASRGFDDWDETAAGARYQHVRVSTKNERWDARTVDSFYATMSEGLAGCADLAGDRDGWVEAGELVEYARANGRAEAVAIAQNGNAIYTLCPSRRAWSVPAELYREIERTFTRPEYQKLRDSAKTRRERLDSETKEGTK